LISIVTGSGTVGTFLFSISDLHLKSITVGLGNLVKSLVA
jgi:hypothetical protein